MTFNVSTQFVILLARCWTSSTKSVLWHVNQSFDLTSKFQHNIRFFGSAFSPLVVRTFDRSISCVTCLNSTLIHQLILLSIFRIQQREQRYNVHVHVLNYWDGSNFQYWGKTAPDSWKQAILFSINLSMTRLSFSLIYSHSCNGILPFISRFPFTAIFTGSLATSTLACSDNPVLSTFVHTTLVVGIMFPSIPFVTCQYFEIYGLHFGIITQRKGHLVQPK